MRGRTRSWAPRKPDAGPEKLDYEAFAKKYGDHSTRWRSRTRPGYEEMGDC